MNSIVTATYGALQILYDDDDEHLLWRWCLWWIDDSAFDVVDILVM